MPSSSAIRAGQAFVEVGTDNAKLNTGLTAAGDRLKSFGASVAIIGAKIAAVGGIVTGLFRTASSSAATMGTELITMSERTGLSVEALSELKYATSEAGTSMSALETSLGRLGKTMLGAIQGNRDARQAFANIGLSVEELQGMRPEQQFETIANRLSMINDPALRAAAAIEIFGSSGADLLPLLNKGSAGIDALRKKARDLGLTMSGEDAAAAKAYGDGIRSLGNTISMAWAKLGQAAIPIVQTVVPAFVSLTKVLTLVATAVGKYFDANRPLILLIAKIAAGVVAVGTAIVGFGAILSGLGTVLSAVAGGFAALGSVFGVITALVGAVLSPIGLLVAALAGLAGYAFHTYDGLGLLARGFGTLKSDAMAAFGGITDALLAGDIALAAKIVWNLLKLEWARGTAWISKNWGDSIQGITNYFLQAWAGLQIAWLDITGFLGDMWREFVEYVAGSGSELASWMHEFASGFSLGLYERPTGSIADINDPNAKRDLSPREKREEEIKKIYKNTEQAMKRGGSDSGVNEASKELDQALLEFENSIKAARDKRIAKEKDGTTPRAPQAAAGAQFAGVTAPALSGVSGTFSAAVAGRLSDNSIPGKTLDRLVSIDENIEAMKRRGGVAFAR